MSSWTSMHEAEHCGGSSGSGGGMPMGLPSTGDPMMDLLIPVIGTASHAIGQQIAREIFGFVDPAEAQRRAELQRIEMERQAELERQRLAELERQRRERHARLVTDMAWLGATGDLPLLGLDGAPGEPGAKSASSGPELLSLDDDLRPAGTPFFGLGGGGRSPAGTGRPATLQDLRRAAYLVRMATDTAPEERAALLDEAVRAAGGDSTLLISAPADFVVERAEGKLVDLREGLAWHEGAERSLRSGQNRLSHAEWLAEATAQAEARVAAEVERLAATGADARTLAQKRELLAQMRSASARARSEVDAARREAEIARAVLDVAEWGRREQVISLNGAPWGPPSADARTGQSKLERIYGRRIEVPRPEIPGAIARAENGRKALERVASLEQEILAVPGSDRARAHDHLERARHKAELMAYYDEIINARTLERVEAMEELRTNREAATERIRLFASDGLDTLGGSIGAFRSAGAELLTDPSLREASELLDLQEKLDDAKSLVDEVRSLRDGVVAGKIDFELQSRLSQRASTLAVDLAKDLEVLESTHPKLAKQIYARSSFWVGAGHGIARTTDHTMEILHLHQSTRLLDDRLGDASIEARRLKTLYQKQVDAFHDERRAAERLLSAHTPSVPAPAARAEPLNTMLLPAD
jgi:hypothetical protein